jgi:predicted RNA binding protein YcfA (HicA-like mRNA interferase family)
LTYDELRRKLRRLGIVLIRPGSRHDLYGIPKTQRYTALPRHRGEIPTGTLHRILRDLDLTVEDLTQS